MSEQRSFLRLIYDVLASYTLAVVLLACLFVLTIVGTLYQVDYGLHAAKVRYFESWFIWWGAVPVLPGGMLCMTLLALNLVIGGVVRILRMDLNLRTFGVIVIHFGIIFMLLAGLVEYSKKDEGYLQLYEGEQSSYFESHHLLEVSVWEIRNEGSVDEFIIPGDEFTDLEGDKRRTFTSPDLPFDLELSNFVPNARILPKGPMWQPVGPTLDGYGIRPQPLDPEIGRNGPALVARVKTDGAPKEGHLWRWTNLPFTFEADGRDWAAKLRTVRYEMPFTIRLDDFEMERHPQTGLPKFFRSFVEKIEPSGSERVLIQMNDPLRQDGLVLFQSSWGPQNARPGDRLYSGFSVVRNPSDSWPLYSLWVTTFGMILALGYSLFRFVRRQVSLFSNAEMTGENQ